MACNWVRRRTIVGGVALGGALTVVLVLAGVIHVRVTEPERRHAAEASPSPPLGPLTATQPELREALLAGGDLPEGYRAARSPRTPAARDAGAADRTERCRTLFERPWDVAGGSARERAVGDYAGRRRGALLRQALALFERDGAARAFGQLREASSSCPEFDARLEDGTAVRVQLREMAVRRIGDETYAVRLTTRGERGTQHGYLAMGRVGAVLSVLRHLGGGADPEQVAATLERALHRAAPLASAGRRAGGPGKMESCRPCVSPSPR